ncbi:MAG: Mrp/NBP35 family ATP-binding protein [Planctomycetes bacterium]|nr:Mrp/NBP35 family ATP-binding protein [Planctomycetota bacterium]
MTTPQDILKALAVVRDPDLGRNIVELGFVKDVKVCGDTAAFKIELTTPACPVRELMKDQARKAVLAIPGIAKADITMTSQVRAAASAKGPLLPGVKNILPVASGKGGVGKSTVSANLAVALRQMGATVGLLDADVYGPSIPTIMGVETPPKLSGQRMVPPEQHGVKIMSMGFFLQQHDAAIWRGPMLHKMMEQFLGAVDWGELDDLVVDLPPGTGDIQLSLCQMVSLTGAAVVSTPQDVALSVAAKAIAMFQKLNTPVLGIVENMSYYVCRHCGDRDEIFGHGGAREAAEQLKIPFLGEIPLANEIRNTADHGMPIVLAEPDGLYAKAFRTVAENLAAQVSIRNMKEETTAEIKVTF